MTFKDEQLAFQHLAREHRWLRDHNRRFKDGDDPADLLMFAKVAVILMMLERFVRAILGPDVADSDTLYHLLQKAVSKQLLRMPYDDEQEGIRRLKNVRNTIMHANFELAARKAGCASVDVYFREVFACEVETLYEITQHLVEQIDPVTGKPRL